MLTCIYPGMEEDLDPAEFPEAYRPTIDGPLRCLYPGLAADLDPGDFPNAFAEIDDHWHGRYPEPAVRDQTYGDQQGDNGRAGPELLRAEISAIDEEDSVFGQDFPGADREIADALPLPEIEVPAGEEAWDLDDFDDNFDSDFEPELEDEYGIDSLESADGCPAGMSQEEWDQICGKAGKDPDEEVDPDIIEKTLAELGKPEKEVVDDETDLPEPGSDDE